MQLPEPRRIELPAREGPGGVSEGPIVLSTYVAGPESGPAIVLCHGFPELAYSWRHQISALCNAGFRVIAPDQRGYGASDCPAEIESYGLSHLAGDLVALLDALRVGSGTAP